MNARDRRVCHITLSAVSGLALAAFAAAWISAIPLKASKADQFHDAALLTPYLSPVRRSASLPVSASAVVDASTAMALSTNSGGVE